MHLSLDVTKCIQLQYEWLLLGIFMWSRTCTYGKVVWKQKWSEILIFSAGQSLQGVPLTVHHVRTQKDHHLHQLASQRPRHHCKLWCRSPCLYLEHLQAALHSCAFLWHQGHACVHWLELPWQHVSGDHQRQRAVTSMALHGQEPSSHCEGLHQLFVLCDSVSLAPKEAGGGCLWALWWQYIYTCDW